MTAADDGAGAPARDVFKVLKLPDWWRKKDKAAERRAIGARVPLWLVRAPFVLGVLAAIGEALFMLLFVVRAVGDIEWSFEWVDGNLAGIIPAFDWSLHVQLHPLLFAFLFFASCVIVAWSIVWIPMFLALAGHGWRVRAVTAGTGLFCNALVLMGGFHGQNTNRLEDMRVEVVATRELDAAVTAAESALATVNADLEELRGPDDLARPSIQMQACRAGASAWVGVVRDAEAEANPSAGVIRRASEVAGRCDGLRAERAEAQAALDQARAARQAAVTVREVGAARADGAQAASDWIDEWRPFGISLGLSAIAIFAFWIGTMLAIARALYVEPVTTPAPAAPDTAPVSDDDAGGTAGPDDGDGLVLPPLPDLRGVEDPDFDRLGPMDEQGRRLRRVAGHYRPEPPAKASKSDARRAPEPAPVEPTSDAGGDDGNVGFDDLLDKAAASQAEPAK